MTRPPLAPRPYQMSGAEFLAARDAAICADSMGLGKTGTAALAIQRTQALGYRVLWVAPAATIPGLAKELPRWGLSKPLILKPCALPDQARASVILLSVDAARQYRDILRAGPRFTHLILDEAHTCKNPKARRTRAVYKLRMHADRFWALTGTPMPSRPIELQTMLYYGCRQAWAEYHSYGRRYCYMPNRWTAAGFDYQGCTSTALTELPGLLAPIMIRRSPEDIPGELPPLRRALVPLMVREPPLPFSKQSVIERFAERGAVPFESMSEYRAALGLRKAPAGIAWIRSWLDDNPTESLVVFGWHRGPLYQLADAFSTPFLATGEHSPAKRQEMVDTWAAGAPSRVFVASIGACGIGLNGLHRRATACAFAENPWTPGEVQQAEGRIRRLGGRADSLMSYFLTADDSLESHILSLILEKMERQNRILDHSIGDLI